MKKRRLLRMKKTGAVLLARAMLAVGMTGCGSSSDDSSVSDNWQAMRFFFGDGNLKIFVGNAKGVSEICAGNTEMYFGEGKMNFEIASYIRLGKLRNTAPYTSGYRTVSSKLRSTGWKTVHSTEITCVFGETCVTAVFSVSYRKLLPEPDDRSSILNFDRCFVGEMQE